MADLARVHQARGLTDVLDELGVKSPTIFELTELEWQLAAMTSAARTGTAPIDPDDATKALVFHRLAERERLATADPLEGLPR